MRSLATRTAAVLGLLSTGALPAQLFLGIEASQPIRSTTLQGFPNVSYTQHSVFQVNGMAALGDGKTLLIAQGPFTTDVFQSVLGATPQRLVRAGIDLHGLGYGRDTLYGYSNFGSPRGIYAIDLATGTPTLVLDTVTSGLRFFALDYDPVDDLLYGYSEYGAGGLHAIDIDTGSTTSIAPPIPATNSQGRGLAVANHVVYVTATRGDAGIPCFAWDLRQGAFGTWVPFTNPYPNDHATGGAAFVEVVQAWVGYRGPGRVTVSCTGQALGAGGRATFRVNSTLPGAGGLLLLSPTSSPTFIPQLNSTIAAYPATGIGAIAVDGRGSLQVPLLGGIGPVTVYAQVILRDAAQPTGFAVSNAIRVDFLP